MIADTLLENFDVFAEAPGGIDRLREVIFDLAIRGKLVQHNIDESKPKFEEVEGLFQIANNWIWTSIEKIGVVSPRNVREEDSEAGFVPMAQVQTSISVDHGFELRSWNSIKKGFTHLANGDVAVAKITPCFENGKSCVIKNLPNDIGAGTTELLVVRPNGVLSEYILIFIKSPLFRGNGIPKMTGTAGQKRLPSVFFRSFPMPLPPRAEQKRIVAKVDELMALCDQLEQQQKHRNNLRTATRESAIDAISTATTPEELEAAWKRINNNWSTFIDALEDITSLRRLILDLLMSGNLPAKNSQESNWVTKKFDDLGQCRLGKMLDKAKNTGELRPYLRNTNVQWFRIDKSDVANMRVSQNEADEFTLKAGDLLICEGGQPGRCSIVGAAEESLLFQKALHRFRPNDSTDVKFVAYSLLRASMNGTLEKLFTGVTIKHLTGQSLKGLEIAIPSIGEQERVVAEVDELMALCDQLESELKSRSEVAEKFARSVVSAT